MKKPNPFVITPENEARWRRVTEAFAAGSAVSPFVRKIDGEAFLSQAAVQKAIAAAVLAEREACAKVVDTTTAGDDEQIDLLIRVRDAIRERK